MILNFTATPLAYHGHVFPINKNNVLAVILVHIINPKLLAVYVMVYFTMSVLVNPSQKVTFLIGYVLLVVRLFFLFIMLTINH